MKFTEGYARAIMEVDNWFDRTEDPTDIVPLLKHQDAIIDKNYSPPESIGYVVGTLAGLRRNFPRIFRIKVKHEFK